MGDKVERTAVEVVGCHDMVTGQCNVLQGIGHGSGTAGHSQTGHATLQCCHSVFKNALSGVGQTAVDITSVAQTETVGSML